ncbi:MAG TPA: hypothetical protein VFL57_00605 [Bryobacteraceae bacterium]|nr:hypothetical protein [Bryobacteraceae bacterium]
MAGALEHLLYRARRRHITHAVLDQAAVAICAAVGGLLLLLLLGTQVLNWYWPVALFGASMTVGLYRISKRLPDLYALAQEVDRRLTLHDSISTAWYFRLHPATDAIARQRRAAAELASSASLEQAVPMTVPRSCYALTFLVAVAASLFAMRYLVTHTLDLSRPIARLDFGLFDSPAKTAQRSKSAIQERLEAQFRQMGLNMDPVDDEVDPGDLPMQPNSVAATPDSRVPLDTKEKGNQNGDKPDKNGSPVDGNEQARNSPAGDGKDGLPDGMEGLSLNAKSQPQQPGQKNVPGRGGESSSLLDKMRDAMANLMAKLKLPSPGSEGQQQSDPNGAAPAGAQQASAQRGAQGQNKQQGDAGKQGNATGEQESAEGEQAQAGAGKSTERGSSQPGGQDSKSGVGRSDGDKSAREAEQLAAMGKISEIIGRRASQVSGEMTVEVPSGRQQLKTSYTRRRSVHGDTGGEIGREEIPLMLQPYVQRYFDEIRKTPQQPKARS